MHKTFSPSVLLIAALTLAPAAASAQSREQRQMMATLQILQEQTQQLANAVAALQQSLDESNKALHVRIDESNNATRKGFADQKIVIDAIANDLNKVRTTADDTNVRLGSLREELEAVRQTVLAMPQPATAPVVPGDPSAPTSGASTATPPPVAAPPPPSTAGLSPTRMFETARADYSVGQYSVAITGFDQFIRAFPRSDLADDAQFLIGESQFLQNRFQEAIAAYNQVIQTYPASNSVPDALYKRGLAQERGGDADAARASFEAAVKTYPDSDAGRLAKQNLDRLAARRP